MGLTREQVALLVSAPAMAGGLGAVAVADAWPMRLGGMAMVIGASLALGVTGRRGRRAAWTLAALGAAAVLIAWL
jgi:hypothetical protein